MATTTPFNGNLFKGKVVVFSGGSFALPIIDLLASSKKLAGVIVPDPGELNETAIEVHNLIAQLRGANIPFVICRRQCHDSLLSQLDKWRAELGIIATYPHILPDDLLNYFPFGVFNLHGSLLPAYRGPMPLYWQIRNREKETGIVLHKAETVPDTGNIVVSRKIPIHPYDTLQSLGNQLSYLSCEAVIELVEEITKMDSAPHGSPQIALAEELSEKVGRCYAKRPTAIDGRIDCDAMHADEISAMCRAGAGQSYAATLTIKGAPITVLQATAVDHPTYGVKPGVVLFVGEPEGLIICTKDSALRLDVLAGVDGVFGGVAFAERFQIDAGMQLLTSNFSFQQQA